jgi:hypothetical protein
LIKQLAYRWRGRRQPTDADTEQHDSRQFDIKLASRQSKLVKNQIVNSIFAR